MFPNCIKFCTKNIARGGERLGIYYLEKGASQRPSKVVYDRAYSSISKATKEDFDWDQIFEGVEWFHFTGITPALSDEMAEICEIACKKAKEKNIHTCLDTSGIAYNENNQIFLEKLEKLMAVTDLVMLDIKHIDPEEHKKLCKQPNEQILKFAQYLSDINKDTWIRHVVVPTITFKKNYLHDANLLLFKETSKRKKAQPKLSF